MSPPGFPLNLLLKLGMPLAHLQVPVLNFDTMRALLHLQSALLQLQFLETQCWLRIGQMIAATVGQITWTWLSLLRQSRKHLVIHLTEFKGSPWMSFSFWRDQLFSLMGIPKALLVLTNFTYQLIWIGTRWNWGERVTCFVRLAGLISFCFRRSTACCSPFPLEFKSVSNLMR